MLLGLSGSLVSDSVYCSTCVPESLAHRAEHYYASLLNVLRFWHQQKLRPSLTGSAGPRVSPESQLWPHDGSLEKTLMLGEIEGRRRRER